MHVLSKRVTYLLFEAYRRNDLINRQLGEKTPLESRWLGLGTEAAYRPIIEAGLMTWVSGQPTAPRQARWLKLTAAGVEAFAAYEKELSEALAELKRSEAYQREYSSRFQLAGALHE
jgi:hypothetical protein